MSRCSRSLLLATTALAPLAIHPAFANPIGAQVVGGAATVQGQGTAAVTVKEQTNSAIINWQQFNIGVNESTTFVQPNAASVILNRVTGNEGPSEILGTLASNGKVFLVNPDGLLFGSGAVINTGSFLATTNDIINADFMAGRYNFTIPGKPSASIVNEGSITAQDGGFAALVAPGVRNDGVITATLGTVGLAAGNGFTLDFYGDKLITLGVSDSIAAQVVDVATGQPLDSLVKNTGALKADGGRVELTAAAARQVVDSVINNTGLIEAGTIGTRKGMIVLGAATASSKPAGAPTQVVKVSGTLSAAGKKKGTKGGMIVVTGESVQLASAALDASGAAGGGKVLVGGDTSGGKPSPAVAGISEAALEAFAAPNATNVSVDAGSTINVSAIDSGNGGKAVVWADGTTSVAGTILARGGARAGDGGFVETSGHVNLAFRGSVDIGAPFGKNGTWLLDPTDVTIASSGFSIVTPTAIENALATGNVIVTTSSGSGNGDMFVAEPISWTSANTLTLSAFRNIAVNANLSNTGGAAVNLRADNTGTGVGTISFGDGVTISTSGTVFLFYNPSVNPAGSVVNTLSYVNPTEDFYDHISGGGWLRAYMLVNTVYDLQNVQNNLSGIFAVGRDIDATSTAKWTGGAGFLPIGNESAPFVGTLFGNGYSINNLSINTNSDDIGLFGFNDGYLANVTLANASISGGNDVGALAGRNQGVISNSSSSGSVSGDTVVGGLVGLNWVYGGSITNSHSAASVTGVEEVGGLVGESDYWSFSNHTTIGNSYATGVVRGQGFVGGLVGLSEGGTIDGSHATGSVTGSATGAYTGGLVGMNNSNVDTGAVITNSYATGTVVGGVAVGGLVGANEGYVFTSYATGPVSSISGSDVGGLVGLQQWGGVVIDSYALGSVTGLSNVGGIVGSAFYGYVHNSYSTGLVSGGLPVGGVVGDMNDFWSSLNNTYWDTVTSGTTLGVGYSAPFGYAPGTTGLTSAELKSGLPSGFDPTVWGSSASINNGYPYLLWQTVAPPPPSPKTTTLTSQIEIVVEAEPETKVYGSVDPTLAYQVVSGTLADGVTFSGTLTRDTGENVGTYTIDEGTLSLPSLYALEFEPASFTITPAPLTITANNAIRMAGQPNPVFTASYSGFVLGDQSSVVSDLTLSTPATANSGRGSYAIVPGGAIAANYAISYVDGKLTVVQPPPTITSSYFASAINTQVSESTVPVISNLPSTAIVVPDNAGFSGSGAPETPSQGGLSR